MLISLCFRRFNTCYTNGLYSITEAFDDDVCWSLCSQEVREAQEALLPPSMRAAACLLHCAGHARGSAVEPAAERCHTSASHDNAATIVVAKFRWGWTWMRGREPVWLPPACKTQRAVYCCKASVRLLHCWVCMLLQVCAPARVDVRGCTVDYP
jgi:hypothetical protein